MKSGAKEDGAFPALDSRLMEMVSDLAYIVKMLEDDRFRSMSIQERRLKIEPRMADLVLGLSEVAHSLGIGFDDLRSRGRTGRRKTYISGRR